MVLKEKKDSKERHDLSNKIEKQLQAFATGFPYLKILSAAAIGDGICKLSAVEAEQMVAQWDAYLKTDAEIVKFVPASGAASRMFKDLFAFLESDRIELKTPSEIEFIENIEKFAFYDDLNSACIRSGGKNISTLLADKKYRRIIENLLLEQGLNYGALPKGLLKFHNYADAGRTPVQEHLVEAALYATNQDKKINIHYTVSAEHRKLFAQHFEEITPYAEKLYDVAINISVSEQKSFTNTIAVDMNNNPIRKDGKFVFRPGGHGALIENLNEIDADVIFIKNIDNVVPDRLKQTTVQYKKVLAGMLVSVQKKCFDYINLLEDEYVTDEQLQEVLEFCKQTLCIHFDDNQNFGKKELQSFLLQKLNRPVRVCGMVKNEGEPGGGPYIAYNKDGTASPQILESSQIDELNPHNAALMQTATHFNPVDLVCATKNYIGEKFNLKRFVDESTGFISIKSKNGVELKA
ncbi:MAG: DUF4301 family protein, partial [Prevotellaceae bacterium]|nr:DUF4301 family protein [Prevotellaceae bacterium]